MGDDPDGAPGARGADGARDPVAEAIRREAGSPRRRVTIGRVVALLVVALSFYLVMPSLLRVLQSWPRLTSVAWWWFVVVFAFQAASFWCVFVLQRLALRVDDWFVVSTSQLAGNALSRVVPGGAAAGAALQFRMLAGAGCDTAGAVTGLTAFSLLQTASVFALPLLTLPAVIGGTPVSPGLAQSALIGISGFVLVAVLGLVAIGADRPLHAIGRAVQALGNRFRHGREPLRGLPERILAERNEIRAVLGRAWGTASWAVAGRLGFDFLSLLAALTAVDARPNPSLVLLAYSATMVLAMIPITPGGLGVVEAGLTATLALAGVPGGAAVLATLVYRLASYWLPLLAGGVAYLLYRRRFGATATALR